MSKINSLIKYAFLDAVRSFLSVRGFLIVLALLFFNYEEIYEVVEFAADYKEPLLPVAMPFIFYSQHFDLMFGIITIFLFSEVPFITNRTTYVILRVGRKRWLIGNIFRILITAILYMLLEVVISVAVCGNNVLWANEWGKVWKTLSVSSESIAGVSVWVPRNVLIQYTPLEAMCRVFIIGSLVVFFIGCLMLLISLILSSVIAISLTGFISVLPYFALNSAIIYSRIYYFSPFSWIGIIEYSKSYIYGGPDSTDMICMLIGAILALVIVLWFVINGVDLKEGKGEEE